MVGDSVRFTRQDEVDEAWRVFQPLLDHRPAVDVYPPGSWGPTGADALVEDDGGWRDPWTGP